MFDDSEIRKMMLDAEEKVPSRVWSAVSSRLDAQPARKAVPVWKWCCAGVAFAAAAALALFLAIPGTEDRVEEIKGNAPVAQLATPPVGSTVPESQAVPDLRPAPGKQPAADVQSALPVQEIQPDRTATSAAQSVPSASPDPEMPAPGDKEERPEDPVEVESIGNLLAMMEYEDTHKASRKGKDIVLGGALSGNTASRLSVSRMSGGTGSVPASDVISERSVSEFGMPFTLGLGLRWHITPKFAIGSGLDYSLLTRTFAGTFIASGSTTQIQGDVRNSQHYIGIPLNLYYSIINTSVIDFYVFGGGEGEYCVANRFLFQPTGADSFSVSQKVKGLQFSVKFGVGVQFRLADHVGLYLDPGASYYFYNAQPKSIRTERPLMFNFNAGLRFDM